MSKFVGIVVGALAVTFGVLLDIGTFGALTAVIVGVAGALLTSGTGLLLSGVGTLISSAVAGSPVTGSGATGGIATASRNPIAPWQICYGANLTGGRAVLIQDLEHAA